MVYKSSFLNTPHTLRRVASIIGTVIVYLVALSELANIYLHVVSFVLRKATDTNYLL